VVAAVVVADLLAQTLDPVPHVYALGHARIIRAVARRPKRAYPPTRRTGQPSSLPFSSTKE
jgi:hypothetical protein